jgi:Microcystin-dependent protein
VRVSDNFLGEIRVFSFGWAPTGWALCNGATMQILQNQALYALLGTQFGGNGTSNFNLPDLQGRTPVYGVGYQGLQYAGGQEAVALTADTMPTHSHAIYATTNNASSANARGDVLATVVADGSGTVWPIYSGATANATLAAPSVSSVGAGATHANMQPFAVVNFCIALQGIWPTRQ